MEGTITSFRRSLKKVSSTHMIVMPSGTKDRKSAEKLVGKKILYNTGKKDMVGKVAAPHGNKGTVRVIFETGMPGQAVGKKVRIE